MSNEHFLSFINIQNYKCFKNLKIENLERVNLIGGVNNIGKTAFLEACYLGTGAKSHKNFLDIITEIIFYREFFNLNIKKKDNVFSAEIIGKDIRRNFDKIQIESKITDLYFEISDNDPEFIYKVWLNNDTKKYNEQIFTDGVYTDSGSIPNIHFLPFVGISNYKLIDLYGAIQVNNLESFVNNSINIIDERITEFKIISNVPNFYLKSIQKYFNVKSFGEGVNRYLAIICAIWASQNGQLFIDEIENGIHYTKYKKLWEIIFKTSQEANCQVFATTHSKECIAAFNIIQNKRNFKESRNTAYFEFARKSKDNSIFVTKRDKEQLGYAIENDMRFRGE